MMHVPLKKGDHSRPGLFTEADGGINLQSCDLLVPPKTQANFGREKAIHIEHRQIIDDTAFLKRLPVQVC